MKKLFEEYSLLEKTNMLSNVKLIETEIENPIFLMFGTLIGAVREGRLIDKDDDIDVCYLSKYHTKQEVKEECKSIYERLKSKGLLTKYFDENNNVGDLDSINTVFGQAHITINETLFDFFTGWIDEEGNFWTCQWGNYGKGFELTTIDLLGIEFNIPKNYDEILTRLYGNWTTPASDHPSNRIERKCYLK